jgi:hypothetical protein
VCVLPLPSAHEAAGATGIRRSPRPLLGGRFINASGAWRGEGVNVRLEFELLKTESVANYERATLSAVIARQRVGRMAAR